MTLVLYNIRPRSHTPSIPLDTAYLLYYILDNRQVNIARIISNVIKMISKSGHRLGSKIPCTLAFSGLIMGMCIRARISIPPVVPRIGTSISLIKRLLSMRLWIV